MTRRGLRWALTAAGLVALSFGVLGVLTGAGGVLAGGEASANVDSELRYFAAWYAAAGVLLLRAARDLGSAGPTLRILCGALFLGACGRVLSIAAHGRPHPAYLVLMTVELGLPVVLLSWYRRI